MKHWAALAMLAGGAAVATPVAAQVPPAPKLSTADRAAAFTAAGFRQTGEYTH